MRLMTKDAIQKLQTETGHVLSVKDFDLFDSLDKLACEFSGVSPVDRRLLSAPIVLSGTKFYPLTVAKSLWYAEKIEEWNMPEKHHDAFFFFVLTLKPNAESFDKFADLKSVNKEMKRLIRRLHCSPDEIKEVCAKCCGRHIEESTTESDENSTEKTSSRYGGLIACLIREYGQTVNYWLYEATIDQVNEFYDLLAARIAAEDNVNRQGAARGGKAIAPRNDRRVKSMSKFRNKINEIRELWSVLDG